MIELPTRLMLDNDAMNALQGHEHRRSVVGEIGLEIYLIPHLYREFTADPDEVSPMTLEQINLVEIATQPEVVDTEKTGGYGRDYGYSYGGETDGGEIYRELIASHPNIAAVDEPEALGAEAAIKRSMTFVSGDGGLKKKMRECGYGENLLPLDEFCASLDSNSSTT